MKVSSTCMIAALAATGHAFSPPLPTHRIRGLHAVDDEAAQALSDYMAKSHVEKLKAIKEVEDKKNSEIVVSYLS
jgi:hypothetical protein